MKKSYFVIIVLLFTLTASSQSDKAKSNKYKGGMNSEAFYDSNQKLKYTPDYVSYLFQLYSEDPKKADPLMLDCAEKLIQKGDEKSLDTACGIYGKIKLKDKKQETLDLAIAKYPKGWAAKEKFADEFSEKWEKDGFPVEGVRKFVEDYKKNYTNEVNKDLDERMLNSAYIQILSCYVRASDTMKLAVYDKLHTNKIEISNFYNKMASQLVGKELSNEPKNLSYAAYLSKKSIDIINEKLKNLKEKPERILIKCRPIILRLMPRLSSSLEKARKQLI